MTDAGTAAAAAHRGGERLPGRPLGPRQRAALLELAAEAAARPASPTASPPRPSRSATARRRSPASSDAASRAPRSASGPPPARRPPASARGARPAGSPLSADQAAALERACWPIVETRDPTPLLLDGVTGSGKTAIYVEAIAASLAAGRPALLLVPEIALATPHHRTGSAPTCRSGRAAPLRASGRGSAPTSGGGSGRATSTSSSGRGTALLAPLADVGLIVVDEEHEAAYKSDRTPRFQARDAALELARLAGAAVVLGSATPVGRERRPCPRPAGTGGSSCRCRPPGRSRS